LPLITTQSGTLLAEFIVIFVSQRVSKCLSFYSLSVCDWAQMLTVFVMIKFSFPNYI